MDWNMIWQLIDPRLMIVVAACWIIGYTLKKTPHVPDWTIIYVVTLIAILLTVWLLGFSPESIIQGILAGAFAVYGNQFIKQARIGADDDAKSE
ncbi:phage holin family protein [Paenibacillus chibensis]|uniref:phage holin family protein n=1 Tax=Paenibacillus chibensis TaxID=59846 RepID=UPI000FDC8311|nr:phage holin family protein [Paenibacillus chibensis]MEC0370901.1 phage holin family protein [Paenibacillus chibensis]